MTALNPEESEEPEGGAEFFGKEVMHARKHKEMSQQELADAAGFERTYVTRVEGGTRLASPRFADACDNVFGTPGSFARLRLRISERGHPGWFVPFVKLEREAATVSDYSNVFIMGMFQTPEYAQAIFRAAHPRKDAAQIKTLVDARMRRRDVLEGENPPLMWVILHEAVLRTVVGGPAVMAGQLEHLADAGTSPHVTLQVLPYDAGAPATNVAFVLLTQDDGPAVLYTETMERGHVTDSITEVANATAVYDRLRAAALSEERSLDLIRTIAKEHVR
ncbi:helix-turn-helix transcriptional regulator [Streptomyces sp. NPDC088725]|uniref:helix-turn-helix domain-containing protein n=1 Tax=Streptomyces sp. NPDC088725 TaxID=3365873 RepID=UPI003802EA42